MVELLELVVEVAVVSAPMVVLVARLAVEVGSLVSTDVPPGPCGMFVMDTPAIEPVEVDIVVELAVEVSVPESVSSEGAR
jgi:hypothetical protein